MSTPLTPPPPSDRLALLYHLSQTFNSSLDLDEVLNRVMDEVIIATQAERGFLMLRSSEGNLVFRLARGMEQQTIDDPQFQISRSVVDRVAHLGQPILTSDAQSDSRLNLRQSVLALGLRSILCVPLQVKGETIGVVYVDNRLQAGIFTQADLDLLTAIAHSAAIAVENARLYALAVEKGRLEQELHLARQVQTSLLPNQVPQIGGWEFVARWQPARQVAGDYYDFLQHKGGRLGLVIGDVTDKGMPAALFMALARSSVRGSVGQAASLAEGIAQANRLICADSTSGMFMTLFYGLLDAQTGELNYVNAGHNPPLVYRSGEARFEHLTRTGIVLGVIDGAPYEERTIVLEPGDLLLLYTDGVTEAMDSEHQEFGLERLEAILSQGAGATADELVSRVVQAVDRYTGGSAPADDITIVAARRLLI